MSVFVRPNGQSSRVPFWTISSRLRVCAGVAGGFPASLGLLLSAGLLGCAEESIDEPSPSPLVSPTPLVTPTPTPCPDGDVDGSCDVQDCAPTDASVHPGAVDIPYDGIDQDCSGADRVDVDGDGVAGGPGGADCNDNDPSVSPMAVEDCGNGVDNDCDGTVDNLPACSNQDYDGDGLTEAQGDCDDLNPDKYPGNSETFDGMDNDCDGQPERIAVLKPGVNTTIRGTVSLDRVGTSVAGIRPAISHSLNADAYADLLVGAPGLGGQERGAAALYFGSPSWAYSESILEAEALYTNPDQTLANAGFTVASAGDSDYDGKTDLAIAAPFFNQNTITDAGRIWIFAGQDGRYIDGSLDLLSSATIPGYFSEVQMGTGMDSGDVTGDGYEDFLFTSPTSGDDGWVFIFENNGAFPASIQSGSLTKIQAEAGRLLGSSIAFAGDNNGDGIGDLVAGGAWSSGLEGYVLWLPGGSAWADQDWFVFGGATAQTQLIPAYVALTGSVLGERAGWSSSGGWDVNGDGGMDFVVGDGATKDRSDPAVFLFLGGASRFLGGSVPVTGTKVLRDEAEVVFMPGANDACPCAVSLEGDLNGDGYADVLIGASESKPESSASATGRVYIFLGRPNWPASLTLDIDADYILDGASAGEQAGYSVTWVGDMNGDFKDELAVGAPGATELVNGTSMSRAGRVYVLPGISAPTPSGRAAP